MASKSISSGCAWRARWLADTRQRRVDAPQRQVVLADLRREARHSFTLLLTKDSTLHDAVESPCFILRGLFHFVICEALFAESPARQRKNSG
jgi:hypothetical protein